MTLEEISSQVMFYALGVISFLWAVALFIFMFSTRHADRQYSVVRLAELDND